MRIFKVREPSNNDGDKRNITTPRTFTNVTLADGRKISVMFSARRDNGKYLANWQQE